MSICVTVDIITKEMYISIIEFYNTTKPVNEAPLEILDRCEGGFQIQILDNHKDSNIDNYDKNTKIKQLRWSKKCLVPFKNYKSFSKDETFLLFRSMHRVLGDKVSYII